MIGVEEILNILKVAVWSGALKGERPLSIMIIASVGAGKTTMLKKVHRKGSIDRVSVGKGEKAKEIEVRRILGSVLYTTSTTPYVLCNRYGQLLKSGQIKHIAIPDFLSILNLPRHVYASTLNFYNSLVEEGVLSIESRDGHFVTEVPVQVGLLSTIAIQDLHFHQEEWANIGFLSRVLPISFSYNNHTMTSIRKSIKQREYLKEAESFNITLPEEPQYIHLPGELADIIEQVAMETKDSNDVLGGRRQKQLQVFCMARALAQGRDHVNDSDVALLQNYKKYFNTNCSVKI